MRRSFTLFSVGTHTIVIAAALYAQILADSALLPTPHTPLLFDSGSFMPAHAQLPRPRVASAARTHDTVSANAAPLVAPSDLRDETGRESEATPPPVGLIPGIASGPPSSAIDLGIRGTLSPPPAEPAAPIRLHSGMKAPVRVADMAPTYPATARSAHIQGVVILEAVLDATGRVELVRVLRSIPLLDQAAVEAVQQWRFTPALLNGEPVPVVMTVTVHFTLRE